MNYTTTKECIKDVGRETLEDLIEQFGIDLVEAYVDSGYSINYMEDTYNGCWESDEEFVQDLVESCGDIPKDLPFYIHIDWRATARDIMMDYVEIDGHYFRV